MEEHYNISNIYSVDWLIDGDFNELLKANEKLSGCPINNNRFSHLWKCLNYCNMVDLGVIGCKYTWTNKRHHNRTSLILERLDCCVDNNS